MRRLRFIIAAGVAGLLLAGCGNSSPPAGQSDAASACRSGGAQAARLAAQAAATNPKYDTLSVDERALAANEQVQNNELSDGNPSDDSGLGALTGADSVGSSADLKVLSDCVSLGLPVVHH
jgi:outer membrane murein-binding lipoprotein Lpp